MPWWGWVIIAAICVFVLGFVVIGMIREDPNRRARRGIAKGKRG